MIHIRAKKDDKGNIFFEKLNKDGKPQDWNYDLETLLSNFKQPGKIDSLKKELTENL